MTALTEFRRLEAQGAWKETPRAGKREVVVSLGEATLTLMDPKSDCPLSHWSLPAVVRLNPGRVPAVYTPTSAKPDETVEIDDQLMIDGIARVQRAIAHHRRTPGRLRGAITGLILLGLLGALVAWLPDALIRHAAQIAPPAQMRTIGTAVLADLETGTGSICHRHSGQQVLDWITSRLLGKHTLVQVVPGPLNGARRLPGNMYLIGNDLLASATGPEATAGHLIAASIAQDDRQVTQDALEYAGAFASLRLMTLGTLPRRALEGYGKTLLEKPLPRPDMGKLPAAFEEHDLSTEPYARSLDPTGVTVMPLITGDPMRDEPAGRPLLTDEQWLALQKICAG
ncbi:hypothetical protein [Paracoccus sp. JM45]|uniref:hypothetical protein n=1 Tax=Paracoccus sp. JM45 TaxID=2283626 RepID=UPI000E6BA938|nr:hypothetical protein [Paracoccus sp. JM45]RJE79766.1 hypothetical protein DWB67_10255 [Paracoccus sp. JM45]